MTLKYRSRIDSLVEQSGETPEGSEIDAPDRRDGLIYDCTPKLQLAVEVALTTGRPLLLRGDPGSGKSSLASFVARRLGWRYYEHVVTSTTRAQDLLWRFDALRRLHDAQLQDDLDDRRYVEPGVLWWAFDAKSAAATGSTPDPNTGRDPKRAVVLIDELDKADADVPNGLLVPLASTTFRVDDLGGLQVAREQRPVDDTDPLSRLLVIITTNEERDLPPAFLRRCIDYTLPAPDAARLVRIARLHLESEGHVLDEADGALLDVLAARIVELRAQAGDERRRPPSTAEYLDAVRACRSLGVRAPGSTAWEFLERVALAKTPSE